MDLFHFEWETVPFRMIAFVIAFSLHEWAHAFVAWKLGDHTAKDQGRLTINPIPHIDPFGLILILFGPFGWAKPVPINPLHFRGNKRLGIVYVSAAGPLINLVLAFLFMLLYGWVIQAGYLNDAESKLTIALNETLLNCVLINCALFVFNLLPIHPLDGSKIIRFLLPSKWDRFFYQLEIYGPWVLLLLIFLPAVRGAVLNAPLSFVVVSIDQLAGRILSLF